MPTSPFPLSIFGPKDHSKFNGYITELTQNSIKIDWLNALCRGIVRAGSIDCYFDWKPVTYAIYFSTTRNNDGQMIKWLIRIDLWIVLMLALIEVMNVNKWSILNSNAKCWWCFEWVFCNDTFDRLILYGTRWSACDFEFNWIEPEQELCACVCVNVGVSESIFCNRSVLSSFVADCLKLIYTNIKHTNNFTGFLYPFSISDAVWTSK